MSLLRLWAGLAGDGAGRITFWPCTDICPLTGLGWVAYTASIDGGAADERVAGFDASEFALRYSARQGLPGVLSSSLVWLWLDRTFRGFCALRCLTIISEERETWTAVSLRLANASTALYVRREITDDVTFPDSSRFGLWGSSLGIGADVFGTRRDC